MLTWFSWNFMRFSIIWSVCTKSINWIILLILAWLHLYIDVIISSWNIFRIFNIFPWTHLSSVSIESLKHIIFLAISYSYPYSWVKVVPDIICYWLFSCSNGSLAYLEEINSVFFYMNLKVVFPTMTTVKGYSIISEI